MRIIYFGNNWLGLQALKFLKEQGEEITGLVVHPALKQRHGREIIEAAALPPERVFEASLLHEAATLAALAALKPDIGVSVSFGYILRRELLACFPSRCINLHTSFLPWNRGAHPNVWSIVDRTPAGATLHFVDAGVDTGDIIAQAREPVEPTDTGHTLYGKLEQAALSLFVETWPAIREGAITTLVQEKNAGSAHRVSDLAKLDEIDLERSYLARDLIDILRARTFPPYRGAYFLCHGRRIFLNLTLQEENPEDAAQ